MTVQAIVLPYYGIGDFLTNLTFINALLKEFPKDKFIIIKIPVVSSVVYGRKVGYKIRKIDLPSNIEKISATKIRNKLI